MAGPADSYDVDCDLAHWEQAKAERLPIERIWQETCDYVLPRREFAQTSGKHYLRPRRITSNVAPNANDRMAALILSYAIDPTRPFFLPNVHRGLVSAGRETDLKPDAIDYLGRLEWQLFDRMMLPKAQLAVRLHGALKEFCAIGNMVLWTGRKRGFGPYFQARPVQSCWWSKNEQGEVDTLYYLMRLPIWRIVQRWPDAKNIDGWEEKAAKRSEDEVFQVLHVVKPRPGGKAGAVKEAKPFASRMIVVEKKQVIEEAGYDSFPYAVGLYEEIPGQTYALGPGCKALPDIKVLNNLIAAVEDGVEGQVRPPLAVPARLFGKTLDRRPGAVNAYNPAGLGLQKAADAIQKLDVTGNVEVGISYLQYLTNNIELAFFVDWMRLRENGTMTATEITDRRDLRLRGLSSIVALIDKPVMGTLADRALEVMNAEGLTEIPPASLAGVDVDWEYAGPLQIAQLQGQVQGHLQLINARGLVAAQDPAAAQAVNLEEALRAVADGLGEPTGVMNSRMHVQQQREAMQQQAEQAHEAQMAQAAGQTARDAGQGINSVASAAGQMDQAQGAQPGGGAPAGPGGQAGFAPAAPFAAPLAMAA